MQVPSTDGLTWLATQGHDEHHVVRLRQDDSNRIDVIALAAASRTDVDALAAKVKAAGAKIIHDPRALTSPGGGYGFRSSSPDGLTFEVSSDVHVGARREIARWEGVPVKISHIVLHSPDHKAAVKFMTEVPRASRCRTGWVISWPSCAAIPRITAWRCCPAHPASTTWPTT